MASPASSSSTAKVNTRKFDNRSGTQNIATDSSTLYNNTMQGSGVMTNIANIAGNPTFNLGHTETEIDRRCLEVLKCPDSFQVMTQLKTSKDALLRQSFEWILHDPAYVQWCNGNEVGLLWIKGGAGKGKTMMSIGLVEELSRSRQDNTIVTYFFCQNADYSLNTVEAIVKGLIRQLIRKRKSLMQELRDRWDQESGQFTESIDSWQDLWVVFLAMLDRCKQDNANVYIIIDALDECGEYIEDLLKLIVSTGLDQPHRIKWLVTSRPLDSAERVLLAYTNQALVSLELNSDRVRRSVIAFVSQKVVELGKKWRYSPKLQQDIEERLADKAEGTFLWVSLVCKELHKVGAQDALATIDKAPKGLRAMYERAYKDLCKGELACVEGCTHLLSTMMLAYRPLTVMEVSNLIDLGRDGPNVDVLVDRCASFVRVRDNDGVSYVEFMHQSARDFLAVLDEPSSGEVSSSSNHIELMQRSLSCLTTSLTPHFLQYANIGATRQQILRDSKDLLIGLEYAAEFWSRHFEAASYTSSAHIMMEAIKVIEKFLRSRFLEWLEYLTLKGQLPLPTNELTRLLQVLTKLATSIDASFLVPFVEDAVDFLPRHYPVVSRWPLQVYISALVFSPEGSLVRRANIDRLPEWLRQIPEAERSWPALRQTLKRHTGSVNSVAFSPDGRLLASGSDDNTVKLWEVNTGQVYLTMRGHSNSVISVAFSPDNQLLASGSIDSTVIIWEVKIGQVQQILNGDSGYLAIVAFSSDGLLLGSGSYDSSVKLLSVKTGEVRQILTGQSRALFPMALSPNGQLLAAKDGSTGVTLWSVETGELRQTLDTSGVFPVQSIAFSPDSRWLASGQWDKTINKTIDLWSVETGELQKTLELRFGTARSVAFSPDSRLLAAGCTDGTIRLWGVATGELHQRLEGHFDAVTSVAFSPDSRLLVSGGLDQTVRLWDVRTGDEQRSNLGSDFPVESIRYSPDGSIILSKNEFFIDERDAKTGEIQRTQSGSTLAARVASLGHSASRYIDRVRPRVNSLSCLLVKDQWIVYGSLQLLRFPAEFNATCYDSEGDRITVGFKNGRVLCFTIDRQMLSTLL